MGNVIIAIPSEWVEYDRKKGKVRLKAMEMSMYCTYGDCNEDQPSWKEFKRIHVIGNTYDKDGKLTQD